MVKVITYGTYDLLHRGHIKLLERAKALGDYLIVGITADGFDEARGKINVQQSLSERIESVRKTGLADEIIVEEYEGQKIDDIIKYNVDIFTVGSDWIGVFDYLNEYCKVVYLPRTKGVSSSDLRSKNSEIKLGLVGNSEYLYKVIKESEFINGLVLSGISTQEVTRFEAKAKIVNSFDELLDDSDAVYIHSNPSSHYNTIKKALQSGKHVLCESPIAMSKKQCEDLFKMAENNNLLLMEALRTAYSTAYHRLLLLIKSGVIGDVVSVDAVCTSLKDYSKIEKRELSDVWSSINAWGPTALLPIFQILGTEYSTCDIVSRFLDTSSDFDVFTKIALSYPNAVASMKVGNGIKSESELIISGTKGYVYVPSPWWKTDYFEIRFENPADNKRYYYQLEGEGIRNELSFFIKSIKSGRLVSAYINKDVSVRISEIIERFSSRNNIRCI